MSDNFDAAVSEHRLFIIVNVVLRAQGRPVGLMTGLLKEVSCLETGHVTVSDSSVTHCSVTP